MNLVTPPTLEQVLELDAAHEAVVAREHIDANGHMNVRFYLDFNAWGTERVAEEIGITETYRTDRGMGLFTAEQHLRYYAEMREGDKVSVHVRVLERGRQSAHMMAFLLDRTHGLLTNTLELVVIHVDLHRRRATPMPRDIAESFDSRVAQSDSLTWTAPTCGAISLSRT